MAFFPQILRVVRKVGPEDPPAPPALAHRFYRGPEPELESEPVERIADAQVTTRVVTSPDPLAEEKADGRVVKLTGPGSLLHTEPVERIDLDTGASTR